ncbi:hypothetical protein ACQKKX_18490 [Neorhizobium sp. NPDC001467]|uniref:hypothetical protein n=1 Tax=Neorhizobium sp. NPDC001467 TaxID=3390595 RepID=UPI003D089328
MLGVATGGRTPMPQIAFNVTASDAVRFCKGESQIAVLEGSAARGQRRVRWPALVGEWTRSLALRGG